MADELPPLVTRLLADISGLRDGLAEGAALTRAYADEARRSFGSGKSLGEQFGHDLSDGIHDAIPAGFSSGRDLGESIAQGVENTDIGDKVTTRLRDERGRFVAAGKQIGDGLGQGVKQGLPGPLDTLIPPVEDNPQRPRRDGEKTGKAFNEGISPLLLGAFTAAATIGPAAILAGTAGAVVGVGTLISRSNADIQAEYKTLAGDVSREMTGAVAPLAPAIEASMVQADTAIGKLGPTLKQTFADAEPDVSALTGGIVGLAGNALPGLEDAINRSRGIVSGFSGSLPTLGTGVGRFFTGLTTDAQSTEHGIVDFVDVTSNALGTLGHVAGSASAALSTDFGAIEPALNGALSVIDKVSSPAVIGGLIGLGGAMKFDPAISTGLQKVSNGFVNVAAKADGARGPLGLSGKAAEKAAGGFGTMADVMGGPWGIAIGAGVGLLGGLVSSLSQAKVSASDFTAAVAQDNGVVGASTTAIIQNQIAKLDLTSVQKDLGVSQATLIEYAAGEKDAQDQVNAVYDAKQAALDKLVPSTERLGRAATAQQGATRRESNELANAKVRLDAMTSAVQQAIKDQNDQSQSYLAATKSAGIFAGMVDTATTSLEVQANQQGINAVAALSLADAQWEVNQRLSDAIGDYALASSAASAYKAAGDALYGKYADYSQAQATFTTDLNDASKAFKAGQGAADLYQAAGAANFTVAKRLADANEQVAQSLIAQGGSAQDATTSLRKGAQAIDDLALKSGFTEKQVEQLNKELYGVPTVKQITFKADTTPVIQALNGMLQRIDSSSGTVQIYAQTHDLGGGKIDLTGGGRALGGRAAGGPVEAGVPYLVGENEPEVFVPGARGYITPRHMLEPGAAASRGGFASFASASSNITYLTINVNAGTVLSHTVQFEQAVATALARWGSRVPNQNMSWQSVRGLKRA